METYMRITKSVSKDTFSLFPYSPVLTEPFPCSRCYVVEIPVPESLPPGSPQSLTAGGKDNHSL